MLVFDIELISFNAPASKETPSDPTKAPDDVQRPPADAKRTGSGLSYKILKLRPGGRHPEATNSVTVRAFASSSRASSAQSHRDPHYLKRHNALCAIARLHRCLDNALSL